MLVDASTENLIARVDIPCDESACRIRLYINLQRHEPVRRTDGGFEPLDLAHTLLPIGS